jgi:hypothetical protein
MVSTPLSRLVANELRGVTASDLPTRLTIAVLLVAISVAALWRPAWRATTSNLSSLLSP